MLKKLLLLTLAIFMLYGCSAVPVTVASPAQITSTVAQPTALSSPVITPTAILTMTAPEPTSGPTIIPGTQAGCVSTSPNLQTGYPGNGVIILQHQQYLSDPNPSSFNLLNLESGVSTNLTGQNDYLSHASVTQDRSKMSVIRITYGKTAEIEKKELLLMTADGKIQKVLPMVKGSISTPTWINNQVLMVNIAGLDPEEGQALKPSTLLAWNPFTGEKRVLRPDFPDLAGPPFEPLPNWDDPWNYSLVVYNPTLTRAIYLGGDNGYNYTLWNMQKKQKIMSWVNLDGRSEPRWSPDGSQLVMDGVLGNPDLSMELPYKLYLVDNDGRVSKQVTETKDLSIVDYFWSTSGKYIALLLNTKISNKVRLAILNPQTLEITDTCLVFNPTSDNDVPIWSPDDTQILLKDEDDASQHWRVLLVDLAKKVSYPIAEDMEPMGWMKMP